MIAFLGLADGAAELSGRVILMSDQDRAASVNPPAVMYNPMLPLPGLSPVGGKKVVGDFDAGLLSSDGRIFGFCAVGSRQSKRNIDGACRWDGGGIKAHSAIRPHRNKLVRASSISSVPRPLMIALAA
jgi:hypothetical protein